MFTLVRNDDRSWNALPKNSISSSTTRRNRARVSPPSASQMNHVELTVNASQKGPFLRTFNQSIECVRLVHRVVLMGYDDRPGNFVTERKCTVIAPSSDFLINRNVRAFNTYCFWTLITVMRFEKI
jgi:hypothetical protein